MIPISFRATLLMSVLLAAVWSCPWLLAVTAAPWWFVGFEAFLSTRVSVSLLALLRIMP